MVVGLRHIRTQPNWAPIQANACTSNNHTEQSIRSLQRPAIDDASETTRAHGPEYDGIAHGELPVRVAVVVNTLCRNYCRVITNSDKLLVAPSPSLSIDGPPPLPRLGRRPSEVPKLGTADSPS